MLLSSIAEEEQLSAARQTPRKALDAVVGHESCVILGRCGSYAYDGQSNVMRVFLSGRRETRITHLMKKHRVNRNEAIATMDQTDNRRKTYYRYYTGQEWGYANNYDICIAGVCSDLLMDWASSITNRNHNGEGVKRCRFNLYLGAQEAGKQNISIVRLYRRRERIR